MKAPFGRRAFLSLGLFGATAFLGSAAVCPSMAGAINKRQPFNLLYNGSFEEGSSSAVTGWTIA
jgi:hypothetical protein